MWTLKSRSFFKYFHTIRMWYSDAKMTMIIGWITWFPTSWNFFLLIQVFLVHPYSRSTIETLEKDVKYVQRQLLRRQNDVYAVLLVFLLLIIQKEANLLLENNKMTNIIFCHICGLTLQSSFSKFFIVNFEHISHLCLVFLLLTLNI